MEEINFKLPVDLSRLESDRMRLVPLHQCSDSIWDQFYRECSADNPEVWRHIFFGPFQTRDDFYDGWKRWNYLPVKLGTLAETKEVYTKAFGKDLSFLVLAIMLKAGKAHRRNMSTGEMEIVDVEDGTFAGTTGLLYAEPENSCVEVGALIICPRFQRTYVSTHANAILLKHLLDPIEGGDLGMRRVQWQTSTENEAGMKAPEKLGLKLEGIIRWRRVIGEHKTGATPSATTKDQMPSKDKIGRKLGPGRHDAMYAMCWDDWLEGGRDCILEMMKI